MLSKRVSTGTFSNVNAQLAEVGQGNSGTDGQIWTADGVGGATFELPSAQYCRVINTADIIIQNTTWSILTFNTNIADTNNIHSTSTNTSRLVCKESGFYSICANVNWYFNAVASLRRVQIIVNGLAVAATNDISTDSSTNDMCVVANVYMNVNDYAEVKVYQNSGSALTVTYNNQSSPVLSMIKIGKTITSDVDYTNTYPLSNRRATKIPLAFQIDQDGAIVGDELWCFTGSAPYVVRKINPDTGAVSATINHTLGHCNGVDYLNDTLLAYYGTGIYLYSSPTAAANLYFDDAACTTIEFHDAVNGKDLLTAGSACFGENEKIIYYMTGVDVASETKIYKILLGMGDNDLHDTVGNDLTKWGAFVAGKSETEYNGTAKVLKTFTGVHLSQSQGMKYNGFLYVGIGFSTHLFYKIQLNENLSTFAVACNFDYNDMDYTNVTETLYEPELVAIKDGKLYCGSRNVTDTLFVRFDEL